MTMVMNNVMDKDTVMRQLLLEGWQFERHGRKHSFYRKGDIRITIPRSKRIPTRLLKMILIQMDRAKTGLQSGCVWRGAGR